MNFSNIFSGLPMTTENTQFVSTRHFSTIFNKTSTFEYDRNTKYTFYLKFNYNDIFWTDQFGAFAHPLNNGRELITHDRGPSIRQRASSEDLPGRHREAHLMKSLALNITCRRSHATYLENGSCGPTHSIKIRRFVAVDDKGPPRCLFSISHVAQRDQCRLSIAIWLCLVKVCCDECRRFILFKFDWLRLFGGLK